jgi:hypothetical protein
MMRKQSTVRPALSLFIAVVSIAAGVLTTGCSGKSTAVTEEEKKNWTGTTPPPGFEKEMERHNREWRERDAKVRAKLGESAKPPEGVSL